MEIRSVQSGMTKFLFLALFVAFSFAARFLEHAPNFVPIGALALWAGVYLHNKKIALALPLLVMFASDLFIGFYHWQVMASVYFGFAIMVFLGWLVKRQKSLSNVIFASFGGAIFFYLTTNFAVWATSSWYPQNLYGLLSSYTLALPFFRNSLMSDLFYGAVFFGVYEGFLLLKKKLPAALSGPRGAFNSVFRRSLLS